MPADGRPEPSRPASRPPVDASRPIELDVAAGRVAIASSRAPADRLVFPAAIVMATLIHAALLLALEGLPANRAGAGGIEHDAVSVEVMLVPATAMATLARQSTTPAPAVAVDATEGESTAQRAANVTAVKTSSALSEPHPLVQPDISLLAVDPPAVAVARPTVAQPTPEPSAPAVTGGATATGASSEQHPTSAPAASPGEVMAYARSVVAALGRSRPKIHRSSGRATVRVLFAIGEDGTVAEASVKLSSGRIGVDELALAAVRRTQFPPPPALMTRKERTYEVPYHFR